MKYDSEIRCDQCQNSYHELCILKYNEDVVRVSEYREEFPCRTGDREENAASEKW